MSVDNQLAKVERVQLSEEFLSGYYGKQPKWGFDGLGYIVYLRTYSRKKEDGTLEQWAETVKRITEGNFKIEAKRLAELRKLSDTRLERLILKMKRFYHWTFNLVMTPPGRGLWMSGTEYAERVGDAENNCILGSERVFVKDYGLVPIGELNGEHEVLSDGGVYRKAHFKSYGVQKLMKITFRDGQEVYATPNHQWIVLSGNNGTRKKERVNTVDLLGHKIPVVRPEIPQATTEEGIAHGYVFGDGTRAPGGYCKVVYYDKDNDLFNLISKFGNKMNSKLPTITTLPHNWKKLPKIEERSKEYLLGFLMGWLAADGHVRKGNIRLFCKDENQLEYAREIAMYLGLKVSTVGMERELSPFDGTIKPLYRVTFSVENFPGNLLAIEKQKNVWNESPKAKRVAAVPYKEVISVEMTDIEEEVFCCNEPETHSFVIDGHILTGNCWGVSQRPQSYFPGEPEKVSFAPVFTFDQAMKGGGVGVNVQRKYVSKIPKVGNKVELKLLVRNSHADIDALVQVDNVIAFPGTPQPEGAIIDDGDFVEYTVDDSRQGWAKALAILIDAHYEGKTSMDFDMTYIRPYGAPIKGFGGVASGPKPLAEMLNRVNQILNSRVDDYVTPTEWGDVIQNIGCCVVAGNVRRTALILIGDKDDQEYIESKNYSLERNLVASQWRWSSNNSVDIDVDADHETLRNLAVNIYYNGEPGYVNINLSRNFGRIIDGFHKDIDGEVEVFNPCGEITLPNGSPCNLFEVNLPKVHELVSNGAEPESLYNEVMAHAAEYAYRITLRPYEWAVTRDIVSRHRRLGVGITGITDWVLLKFGEKAILGFDNEGNPVYNKEVTLFLDRLYKSVRKANKAQAAELELCVSIKVTTVKPSGTVSLLMGVSPGQHFHWSKYMIRRVRMSANAPLVPILEKCGYYMEPAIKGFNKDGSNNYDYNTLIVEFPVKAPTADHPLFQGAGDVPLKEQAALQAMLAIWWSDNAVSATLSFHKAKARPVYFEDGSMLQDKFGTPRFEVNPAEDEAIIDEITDILDRYKGVIKSTSLLPYETNTYPQMPYEEISQYRYEEMVAQITAKPWEVMGDSIMAEDDSLDSSQECVGGSCPIR